jgi:hypothetical protein
VAIAGRRMEGVDAMVIASPIARVNRFLFFQEIPENR